MQSLLCSPMSKVAGTLSWHRPGQRPASGLATLMHLTSEKAYRFLTQCFQPAVTRLFAQAKQRVRNVVEMNRLSRLDQITDYRTNQRTDFIIVVVLHTTSRWCMHIQSIISGSQKTKKPSSGKYKRSGKKVINYTTSEYYLALFSPHAALKL